MDDPELVNRLYQAKVTRVIPKENSPPVNFVLTWILPLAIFFSIAQLFETSGALGYTLQIERRIRCL